MTVGDLLASLGPLRTADAPWPAAPAGAVCTGVTHDSREAGPGTVFVALRGRHADGTAYAPQAVAAGAAAVVAETAPAAASAVPWIVVSDGRAALATLACEYFGHPSREMRVVGITGTNGKTTTSYLVQAMLEAAGIRSGLMGTVAYRIGGRTLEASHTTPEAPVVQRLMREMVSAGCRACVMEVSSHALALRRADGIRFAAAVFTNLTRDHLDFHASMEDYFAAKRRLFDMLPAGAPAVVNVDDPRGQTLADAAGTPVTYGISRPADVSPGPLSFDLSGLQFEVRTPRGPVRVRSALVGRPNVYNILAAVAAAAAIDVPLEAIERGLQNVAGVPGRFQLASAEGDDVTVIVDYAHTDDALRNLLETARPMALRRLITVFGAGGDRDRTKRPLMGMVAARLSDVVIVTSDNPRSEDPQRIIDEVMRGADAETRTSHASVSSMPDRREAIHAAVRQARPGDVVLIAGKGHETWQEIAGTRFPFDDVAVARDALEARRVGSRVG
jgi:UDP-N-acetylmuramoyl-L-alanyl-D-glutamate--2,6-diaminopimelate ligase